MQLIKSLARGLMSAGLKLGLISLALALSIVVVISNPASVKEALRSSGTFEAIIDSALKEAVKGQTSNPGSGAPQEQLTTAAKATFTPAVLEDAAGLITDGIYSWLQGKAPEPSFQVDLTDEKQKFIGILANSAADRAQRLPACSLLQLQELAQNTPDPWSLPCLPAGYDIAAIRDRAVTDLSRSNNLLPDPIITADDFPKDSGGKSIFQTASDAPRIYGWILMAPWIMAFVTLLSAGGLLLLHDDKRRALRTIGITMLGTGIFLFVITAIYAWAFKQSFQINSSNAFQQPLFNIIGHLQNAVSSRLFWFGAVYIFLGLLIVLALHFSKQVEEIQTTTSLGDRQQPDSFNDSVLPPTAAEDQPRQNKGGF